MDDSVYAEMECSREEKLTVPVRNNCHDTQVPSAQPSHHFLIILHFVYTPTNFSGIEAITQQTLLGYARSSGVAFAQGSRVLTKLSGRVL